MLFRDYYLKGILWYMWNILSIRNVCQWEQKASILVCEWINTNLVSYLIHRRLVSSLHFYYSAFKNILEFLWSVPTTQNMLFVPYISAKSYKYSHTLHFHISVVSNFYVRQEVSVTNIYLAFHMKKTQNFRLFLLIFT